jgi:uncharacterized membrane protein
MTTTTMEAAAAAADPWLAGLLGLAVGVALAMRPWRTLGPDGPPLAWLVMWTLLPLLWGTDRYVEAQVVQPLSGAVLLMLMAGWPLAVLALVPAGLATAWLADLPMAEALQRTVWLGLLPATLAVGLGALVRRGLPRHLFVYILGRGFFVTLASLTLSGWLALAWQGMPAALDPDEVMIARWLAAWGDAFLTGAVTAIFVAFRPEWLATYADRIYLPVDPPG